MKTHRFYYRITYKTALNHTGQEMSSKVYSSAENALKAGITSLFHNHIYEYTNNAEKLEIWHAENGGTARLVYLLQNIDAKNFEHVNG